MSAVKQFFDSIRVHDVPYTKVRVGNTNDGGYICLDELNKETSVVYSYGLGTDISFEVDFQRRYPQSEILMFDHTIDWIPSTNPKLRFIKQGIAAMHKNPNDPLNTLDTHMYMYEGSDRPHKILKMDVEWCEWGVFETLPTHVLTRFDQILCEFHVVPVLYKDAHTPYFTSFHKSVYREINELMFVRYKKIMDSIQQHFAAFHVHVNNSLQLVDVDGYMMPPLIELSLINRQLVNYENLPETEQTFPVPGLDFPNKPYRADITDFRWNQ